MLCSPLNSDSPSHLYNSFFKDKVLSPKPTADSCCIRHSIDASHRNSSLSTASPSPTRGFPIRYQCTMPNTKTFISQIPTKASLPPPPLFAVQAPPTFPVFSRCHCLRPVSQSKHNTSVSNSCPDVDIEVAVATVGKVKLPAFVCHIFARPFLGSGIL